jgi:hypothetical protein
LPPAKLVRKVRYYLAAQNEYDYEQQQEQQAELEKQKRETEMSKLKQR